MKDAYRVFLTRAAEKDLDALPDEVLRRVDQAIAVLERNPLDPTKTKKLKGNQRPALYRVRVGDYRIVYTVDGKTRTVTIARIKHRKDVYE